MTEKHNDKEQEISHNEDYYQYNAMINLLDKDGKLQLEQDKVAIKKFFNNEINPNLIRKDSLREKLDYLFDNKYYEKDIFEQYDFNFLKKLYKKAYSYNFRFNTFMGAYKFFKMYALVSYDEKQYLETYEDRVVACAVFLGNGDEKLASSVVHEMMTRRYQPATPTFLNAGKAQRGAFTSCFLLNVSDNLESINRAHTDATQLSKRGGGVALRLTDLREAGAPIKGYANKSRGVVPVMKMYEDAFKYADQLGQRQGAGAVYLNVHHPDINDFLDTKKENADEATRIKTLSIGVVIPDITYNLAKKGADMALFSPYDVERVYGVPFSQISITEKYDEMVADDRIKKTYTNARDLFTRIAAMQFESGYPYILNEDNANRAHNNPGKITHSNLCVTGDTELLTEHGYRKAVDLFESQEDFRVIVDERARTMDLSATGTSIQESTKMFKTAEGAEVFKMETVEGFELKATAWHKMYVERNGELLKIPLAEVEPGDRVPTYDYDKDLSGFATVKSIDFIGNEDVYDVTVDNGHSVVFNSISTGNCSEILQSSSDSTFKENNEFETVGEDISCNLGSLNIDNAFNSDDFAATIETSLRALTTVTEHLDKDVSCSPSIVNGNNSTHSVGLGQMNLHGFLAKNHILYESREAVDFTRMYFYSVLFNVLTASNKIARERGETYKTFKKSKYYSGEFFDKFTNNPLPDFETDKVRDLFESSTIELPTVEDWQRLKESVHSDGLYHGYMQAVAPTGSISYVNESTSSIHPIVAHIETRKDGKLGRTNVPMPYLSEDTMPYYKTAYDVDNKAIIDIYAAAQEFVDQGMSLTLFYHTEDTSTRNVVKTYIYAWTKGIKTLYYARVKTDNLDGTDVETANDLCIGCQL